MQVTDEIIVDEKKFMCTQIFYLKDLKVFRVHEMIGDKEMFMMEENDNYQEIVDKKILKEIYEFLKIDNTDVVRK